MLNHRSKTTVFIAFVFLVFACVMILIPKGVNTNNEEIITTESHFEVIYVSDKTVFTAYTLSEAETDDTPCIGAGNNNLCELKPILKSKGITICASRDLPLDTLIYIEGIGECIIKDRMNKRYSGTNRIDILFDNRQDAINFGKRELNYIVVN